MPVVVAVSGSAALGRAVGRSESSVAGLVAVTTPDRVVVDLSAYEGLAPAGRRVLLTHELTHLATGAAASDSGAELAQGGLRRLRRLRRVAHRRSGRPPRRCWPRCVATGRPPDHRRTPSSRARRVPCDRRRRTPAAWLLCRLVADRAGTAALVAVYRDTAGEQRAAQLRRRRRAATRYGTVARRLGRAWRAELARRLAA